MSDPQTRMVPESTALVRGVRDFFDLTARRFDHFYEVPRALRDRLVRALFHRVLETRFQETLQFLAPLRGRAVLDVGCGPGRYMEAFLREGARQAAGLDFSQKMLDLARERLDQAGMAGRYELLCEEFDGYFPGKGSFDAVVAVGTLEYHPSPMEALRHMAEIAGERLVVSLPRKWTLRSFPRFLRYKMAGCPLRFFTGADVDAMAQALAPEWSLAMRRNLGRDFLIGFRRVG